MAAFVSLSSSQPHAQECQRSESSFLRTVPHDEQTWVVYLGFTFSTAFERVQGDTSDRCHKNNSATHYQG